MQQQEHQPVQHRMQTRLRNNIKQPKVFTVGTVIYGATASRVAASDSEPTSHVEALEHPEWKKAMEDEFSALLRNKTRHWCHQEGG